MAFDTYMKFDEASKIEGEATATGFEKQIEIFSFSWGASNPTNIGSGGTGLSAGKVSISSFNVMKKSEKSSAALFNACCAGTHVKQAVVTMRKATGEGGQKPFLKYTFHDLMVESIQWSGSSGGDDTPTESLSLAFGSVQIEYSTQNSDTGEMAVAGQGSWDLTKVASS